MESNKLVSIVLPAYNESENILKVCSEIDKVFSMLPYSHEIILVADGCTDNTMDTIHNLIPNHKHIFFIEFSRNFGHQLALKAGLDYAKGDCVISMDCDLQHPPELIPKLLDYWEKGFEVVYTLRLEDKTLPLTKRISSNLFYKTLNSLSDVELETGSADFRLLDKKVVSIIRNFHENEPFLRGLFKWVGFKQTSVEFSPHSRHRGKSKYSIKKMVKFALQGVTSFSIKPLYAATYIGFSLSALSILYIPYVLHAFHNGREVSGWASIMMTIVFFGGLQLIILGIIGIYIGKMFMQVKNRPNYIIRSTNIKE